MNETPPAPQTVAAEGQALFAQEQYQEAIARFSEAQQAYAKAGDELKAAEMLNNLGVTLRRIDEHQKAAESLESARQIFHQHGDREREAQVLGNLGGLYSKMKQYKKSDTCYQTAVDIFGELDDPVRQAKTLRGMAIMQFKRGDRYDAVFTYQDALYFLPNPTLGQRIARLAFRFTGWVLNLPIFR